MGEDKSFQYPTRKTPVFMEAVLNKFYGSMEAEVDPSTSTSMLEDPFLPLLYPWNAYLSLLCPAEPGPPATLL